MSNLTKKQLVDILYKKHDIPQKDITTIVHGTLDVILDALAQGRNVEFREFGVFEVQKRKARVGRNPNNVKAGPVVIPERAVIKFKAGKNLKKILKKTDLTKL